MNMLFLLLLLCPTHPVTTAQDTKPLFPEIAGFKRTIIEEVYTAENLFDLIDGAADMFLTYDFQDLHLAEYSNDSIRYIRVEVYRHKNSENAFGAYAQERSPQSHFITIGGEGYLEEGALNFWLGQYYIKLVTNDRGSNVQRALETIASAVAHHLKENAQFPRQFDLFPQMRQKQHAAYYVNRDFLNYSFFNTVFVVPYDEWTLFTIYFDTSEKAQAALKTYITNTLKQPLTSGDTLLVVTDPQEGTLFLQRIGAIIVGAKDIRNNDSARSSFEALIKNVRSTGHQN